MFRQAILYSTYRTLPHTDKLEQPDITITGTTTSPNNSISPNWNHSKPYSNARTLDLIPDQEVRRPHAAIMATVNQTSQRARSPTSPKGHPLPRRASPQHSVTLRHHVMAREASERAAAAAAGDSGSSSPRRQSSNESHNTGPSDPKKWFDRENGNPTAPFSQAMEVDPPFFQKESDSSNEEMTKPTSYPMHLRPRFGANLKPSDTHSSSADDYRSVIDDLTIEIKKLKDELRRHKQKGPDLMKRDKLFEIKVHGLPKRKKRELESTLREFASGLENSTPSAEASSARKTSRQAARLESASGSLSKHASSSSGSHSRPVDSAYASMSTGANSSGTSLARPSIGSRARSSEQKVQSYLKDIPEGLYPRHTAITDKDKKKLVVRRLEQIFTGRISGRNLTRHAPKSSTDVAAMAPIMVEPATGKTTITHDPNNVPAVHEPSREARIVTSDEKAEKKSSSNNNSSTDHSNDQPDSGGNSAVTTSISPDNLLPEQRPTRPLDLDPDRRQVPADNMDYIRHLGLAAPHLTGLASYEDVSPDAEGWVYLNLLCSMAQLHMLNVAPSYVRSALAERSSKFQVSPDGQKIRWRGGTEGTKFSSDSSGDTSQMSRSDESESYAQDGRRKKRKATLPPKSGHYSTSSGKNTSDRSKLEPQVSSVDSFQYQPMFLHHSSSAEQASLDDTGSSYGVGDDSNNGESRWDNNDSASSRRKRRRLDGAIIYYNGAPFCTDLSGDPGDASPSSYMVSTGQDQQMSSSSEFVRPQLPYRTDSGSCLSFRPISDHYEAPNALAQSESHDEDLEMNIEAEFPWSSGPQETSTNPMDACGLGGVVPDDHFVVVATTARPKTDSTATPSSCKLKPEDLPLLVSRITCPRGSSSQTATSTSSSNSSRVSIQYTSRSVKHLAPAPLPPPVMYYALDTDSTGSTDDSISDFEGPTGILPTSGAANFSHVFENHYPDAEDMSSGDEEDEEPDDLHEPNDALNLESSSDGIRIPVPPRSIARRTSSSALAAAGTIRGRSKSMSAGLPTSTGSSAATAGGAESGYSSGREESG